METYDGQGSPFSPLQCRQGRTRRGGFVRSVSLIHQLSMHHEPKAPDGHQSNIPERATGRRTSPSVHACPTPHSWKTLRHPAPHEPRTQSSRARSSARGTRPTDASHPRRQAPPPRTHVVTPTPATHPRRTCAPRMQERPEHTRPRVYPVGLGTCDCNCVVTVSSTGAKNQFQGDDNGHVGRPCQVSPAPPFPEPL